MIKFKKVIPYIIIGLMIISNIYLFIKVNYLEIKVQENGKNILDAKNDNKEDIEILYDVEFIENKYQNMKSGYIQIADNNIFFQEILFDYDDKAILYVKKYLDADFIQYDVSNDMEIYLIEFEGYITKFRKVDYEFLKNNINDYYSRPYSVEIKDNEIQVIIEQYVP